MAENDSNKETPERRNNDRPLGEQSDFRANTEQRPAQPERYQPPEQPRAERPEQEQQPPRNDGGEGHPAGDHRRTGSGMYWAAALISLALLTLFFNNRIEQKQREQGTTEKLLQQRDGHYYARGEINGHSVIFMVDTGASVISIPAKMADEMGLRRLEPEQVSTANGAVTVFNTKPITVQLGDILLYDVEAHINPGMEPPAVLLGMSFLGRLDFRQSENRLILKTRPEL